MGKLNVTVNGQAVEMDVADSRTLAHFLRLDLGLTGTKIGCEEAECGICTVLVDGLPVDSCIYPVFKAQGRSITTIEGLAEGETLHPLQSNFIRHGAVQCGYCTPGLIMTSAALIDEKPEPTEHDIKVALKDTYCRCTGYTSVMQAIQSAAREKRGLTPLPINEPVVDEPMEVISRSVPPQDVTEKVTGVAKYTDDYTFPDMLFARTLRSPHPHARVLSINTDKAKALAGVKAVLTYQDVPGENLHGLVYRDWPVLCGDVVRYTGDAVAIVAAETEEIATEALKLIEVAYEPLPVVGDPEYAHKPEAPVLHPNHPTGNLLKHIKVRHGDVEQGFAEADVIVEHEYRTPTTEHAFLEPECAIGVPKGYTDHQKLTVYVGSQIPYQDRDQIALAMGLAATDVRVIGTLIGGGFGGKEDIAGQIHVALLATVTGKPVKMLYSRQESLIFHPKRHATIIRIKTGAKKDGKLVAVQAELYGDGGAYASLSDKVMTRATTHATGPYEVPNAKIDCYAMYTNNVPSGAFRGFGVTQSAFAVEQNMDMLAEKLNIDPIEFRRMNAQKVGVTTATGQLLRESVGLLETIDDVQGDMVAKSNGHGFRWSWREGNKAYAWGVACAYKNTGLGGGAPDKSEAEIEAFEDGTIEVRTAAADMGQGIAHVVAQCAAEEMHIPYEKVKVLLCDTDLTPNGGPTTASRQTFMTGNAARLAAVALREAITQSAAEMMDVPPEKIYYEEGLLRSNGHSVPMGDVVTWMKESGLSPKTRHEYWGPKTQPLGTGGDMHFAFSYATQAALVEVDTDTGEVHVLKILSSTDIGRAINPLMLQGQIEGGIIMAMGNCMSEAFILEDGVPWSRLLSRYKMPSIKHTPEITSHLVEHRSSDGPYGAKGVGEIPSINTTPAICNAIYNATGVRIFKIPVDQDALLLAMKRGQTEVHRAWQDVR
ncbi:MAG: molybdopterin-dependent oxidoreductase [Chloroflexi bacterium]|nr:molybdopterin-dependent oxidoreductase [Chloroflexota bacterium]MCC6891580.1 molybdopterin-dependent oxidoreductase [Anaerolineae bacterium]